MGFTTIFAVIGSTKHPEAPEASDTLELASIQEHAREVAIQVETDELAHRLVSFAAEKNASAVTLLDIQKLTTIADYFVICTATSTVQMRAIAEGIISEAREQIGLRGRVEGTPSDGWMALDFKDVLVHLFLPEKREYYKLEEFWAAAPAIVQMV